VLKKHLEERKPMQNKQIIQY